MLPLLVAAALAAASPEATAPPAQRRPNLVVLLADDLGVNDLSIYGGARVPTPRIDALGREGARLDAAYATAPICSPSRAALLTGRYQQRFGLEHLPHDRYVRGPIERFAARFFAVGDGWELAPPGPTPTREAREAQGLPASELTIAELLRQYEYHTGVIGKWHLGTGEGHRPQEQGFDLAWGFLDAFSLYADPGREDIVDLRLPFFADRHQWRGGRAGGAAILRDGAPIDEPRYLTDAIAEEACAFIDAHAEEPFFLYVPFNAPHAPLQARAEDVAALSALADPDAAVYAAMVRRLDHAVGEILDRLDARGLAEDTLVVLLSDNGAAAYTHVVDNAPLAGGKFTPLEGGLRVPMLARWPGRIPAGRVLDEPVSALDLFPTLAEAAGVSLPTDRPLDGVSLLPWLAGEASGAPHERLFWRSGELLAAREGDWKLILDRASGSEALYDLAEDPGETRDLGAEHPERVAALRAALEAWESELAPPAWPPAMRYRAVHAGETWLFPL